MSSAVNQLGRNLLQLNQSGVSGFTANFVGNLYGNSTGHLVTNLNRSVVENVMMRNFMNGLLKRTMELNGQSTSDFIEDKLKK